MIGRGSRILNDKKYFNIIDLGNNSRRFGLWESNVNWHEIFVNPNSYIDGLYSDEEIEREFVYTMPDSVKEKFGKSKNIGEFDSKKEYALALDEGRRPVTVLQKSIENHGIMVVENSDDFFDALDLIKLLDNDIEYRIKNFSYCISKNTESYIRWLTDDYNRKLTQVIRKEYGYC